MSDCIEVLRDFAKNDMHRNDVFGYAARDSALELLNYWEDVLRDGTDMNLLQDVDTVIERLQDFRAEAAKHLPVHNGGST